MNMFGMDHMLKDGWSGFYSQGYMYFENCSSLFNPKVKTWQMRSPAVKRLVPEHLVFPRLKKWICLLNDLLFFAGLFPGLQRLSAAFQSKGERLTSLTTQSKSSYLVSRDWTVSLVFCVCFNFVFQSDPSNQTLTWPDKPVSNFSYIKLQDAQIGNFGPILTSDINVAVMTN